VVKAHKEKVEIGYYKLFSISNLVLICNDEVYWLGIRAGESRGTLFFEKVKQPTGEIAFTLNL